MVNVCEKTIEVISSHSNVTQCTHKCRLTTQTIVGVINVDIKTHENNQHEAWCSLFYAVRRPVLLFDTIRFSYRQQCLCSLMS